MYAAAFTPRFLRDVKTCKKRHWDEGALKRAITDLLVSDEHEIGPRYRDHALTGAYEGYRSIHVDSAPNPPKDRWVLITGSRDPSSRSCAQAPTTRSTGNNRRPRKVQAPAPGPMRRHPAHEPCAVPRSSLRYASYPSYEYDASKLRARRATLRRSSKSVCPSRAFISRSRTGLRSIARR